MEKEGSADDRKEIDAIHDTPDWVDLCKRTYRSKLAELREKYAGMYVAINGASVVEAHGDLFELVRRYSAPYTPPVVTFSVPAHVHHEELGDLLVPEDGLLPE